jgi:signal transduction histidine kinase
MRKIYLLFFLISALTFSQKKEGQELIDSLLTVFPKMKSDTIRVNALNEIATEYQQIDLEKSMHYSQKALQLSNKINWQDGIANSYKNIGNYYISTLDYKKALLQYQTGFSATENKKLRAKLIMGIGIVHYMQSDYPKAIESNFKALQIFEEINDKQSATKILRNIATTYFQIEDFNNALITYQKCIKINKEINFKGIDIQIQNEMGLCYSHLNNDLKAYECFNKSLQLSIKYKDLDGEANSYGGLAAFYFNQKNIKKALEYQIKSLALYNKNDDDINIARTYNSIGNCYLELSKTEKNESQKAIYLGKTIENSNKSLHVGKDILELGSIAELYANISQAQQMKGNYKAALESKNLFVAYNDSIYNQDNKETIKNLEDKREIELRDKELKINKLSLESKEKQKWFYILGLGFLAILGGLLFYQSRKRQKTNQKLQLLNTELDQANKTKTRFFSILNHDLRSPVSNLIHFLHLQKENPELLTPESKSRLENQTITGAENLLSSMEDILLWSKGQMENFKPQPKNITVNQLFDDTKKVFSGYLKIKFEYHNPENIELFTDENYLKTIIRNLTSNAINIFTTTENPTIIWKAWKENGKSYLSISDNGSGSTQDKFKALYDDTEVVGIKSGLGLHLIRDLAKAIDCEITVDSKIGIGTTFILKMKK